MHSEGKLRGIIAVGIILLTAVPTAMAKYGGGTGGRDDPYLIYSAEHLNAIGAAPSDWDYHFRLMADIDLSGITYDRAPIAPDTNDAKRWFQGTAFSGVFDGNGHTISHLTITGTSYLGLFGHVDSGEISNLTLRAVDVNGVGRCVGGLAGVSAASISACSSAGTVRGDDYVGGLVGRYYHGIMTAGCATGVITGTSLRRNPDDDPGGVGGLVGHNAGNITSSYSTAMVSANNKYVGGLVGSNCGDIAASYSAGAVSGDQVVGGLVGASTFPDLGHRALGRSIASFWDIETSGQAVSAGGTGLTTAEMQDVDTFLSQGWDFVDETPNGTCDYWRSSPGEYPQLGYSSGDRPVMPEGLGTVEEPYLVRDARDLGTVWSRPGAQYRLEASVDLSGITWSTAVVPWFGGTFDGNGHVIRNLRIQGGGHLGLFGQLRSAARVSDLAVEAVDVNATGGYVGGLAGQNHTGRIIGCYSAGTVVGNWCVGGLTGYSGRLVSLSHSAATVNGNSAVGGLIGYNPGGSITTCYTTGTVTGTTDVGGLVGLNYRGDIAATYSTGVVCGTDSSVGGLVGRNYHGGRIRASYSAAAVTGGRDVGGLVGHSVATVSTSYSTGTVVGTNNIGGLVGFNYGAGRITESYSTAAVTGKEKVGGLVGVDQGAVTACYAAGLVSGESQAGGLIGSLNPSSYYAEPNVSGSFWDADACGQTSSAAGTGLPTVEMLAAGTFLDAGWDFVDETENGTEDVWCIDEGRDYPRFTWELDGATAEPDANAGARR